MPAKIINVNTPAPIELEHLEQLLSVRDVVKLTTLSRPTIYRLVQSGRLCRPLKISGMRVAFKRSDIQKFMMEGVAA